MMIAFLAETVIGFVLTLVFVILYMVRSNWRASPYGRNLMAFMAALMVLLGMFVAGRVKNAFCDCGGMPIWSWVLVFGVFDVIILWRVLLLLAAQKAVDSSKGGRND